MTARKFTGVHAHFFHAPIQGPELTLPLDPARLQQLVSGGRTLTVPMGTAFPLNGPIAFGGSDPSSALQMSLEGIMGSLAGGGSASRPGEAANASWAAGGATGRASNADVQLAGEL